MFSIGDMLSGFKDKMAMPGLQGDDGKLNYNSLGAILGMVGSAIAPQGSWQQMLGQGATQLNQAQIMNQAFKKFMTPSPAGTGGVTKKTETQNPDGTKKITVDMDGTNTSDVSGGASSPVPFTQSPVGGSTGFFSGTAGLTPEQMMSLFGAKQNVDALSFQQNAAELDRQLKAAIASANINLGQKAEERLTKQSNAQIDLAGKKFEFDKEQAKQKADYYKQQLANDKWRLGIMEDSAIEDASYKASMADIAWDRLDLDRDLAGTKKIAAIAKILKGKDKTDAEKKSAFWLNEKLWMLSHDKDKKPVTPEPESIKNLDEVAQQFGKNIATVTLKGFKSGWNDNMADSNVNQNIQFSLLTDKGKKPSPDLLEKTLQVEYGFNETEAKYYVMEYRKQYEADQK